MSDDDSPETVGFNVDFAVPERVTDTLADGFNQYGVREREDGSVDVIFAAMEPGVRKEGTPFEVEITEQFLQNVARKDYADRIPLQFDHSHSQRENVGWVYGDKVKFADGYLKMMAHIPATGSQIRQDTISDFTHDPPAITDGSIGLDPRTVEVEDEGGDQPPRFTDAELQEFSLTPFPAGYEDGGLSPEFTESFKESDSPEWGESRLNTRQI